MCNKLSFFFVVSFFCAASLSYGVEQEPFTGTSRLEMLQSYLVSLKAPAKPTSRKQTWVYNGKAALNKAQELVEKDVDIARFSEAVEILREVKSTDGYRYLLPGSLLVEFAQAVVEKNIPVENFKNTLQYIGSLLLDGILGDYYAYPVDEAAQQALRASHFEFEHFVDVHQFFVNLKGQNTFSGYPADLPIYRPRYLKHTVDRALELLEKNIDFNEFQAAYQFFFELRDNDKGYSLFFREEAVNVTFSALQTPGFDLNTFAKQVERFKSMKKDKADHQSALKEVAQKSYRILKSFSPWSSLDSNAWVHVGRAPVRMAVEALGLEFEDPSLLQEP